MEEQPSPPRVTALIVCRNDAGGLRRCLQCLEASTERDRLEILVIDDGSSDESPRVPDEFPNVVSLRMSKQVGWTRAANIALRTAKGDYILLMDTAVRVEPDTVKRLADRLEGGDAGAVTPYSPHWYPFPKAAELSAAAQTGELSRRQLTDPSAAEISVEYPKGAPILAPRAFLRAMNYMDARFGAHWGDLELCWRIRSSGKPILLIPSAAASYEEKPAEDTPLSRMDAAHGAATWIGLHYGAAAGMRARLTAALRALGRGQWSEFSGILSWTKIDGKQD